MARGDADAAPRSAWTALERELDAWGRAGRAATLWWRDDDASAPSPALGRLLDLAARHDKSLAVAVVPARAVPALGELLASVPGHRVLQHGYAHANHAPPGERAVELGGTRERAALLADLAAGYARLGELFAAQLLPVMVPPWNRLSATLLEPLAALGYRTLSAFAARAEPESAPGLRQINCHVDIIDWRGSRGFRGEARVLEQLCAHLRARRLGEADAEEPTGLLTHHLDHDDACWDFLDRLLARTHAHPAARWLDATSACLAP
ncbi:MAG: polysaccharide deacetylase family protein [Gammaproteobacteria bacterium]|nr:polysaccharide deacetylase family protein [Gammaproteobacteria bacterium]